MSEREPTILSMFAGIGGFDLAFHSAGFRTLAFVEWDATKQIILRAHFPTIPIYGDIDTFDCGEFLRTHERPDVIVGGVPCQAISLLGKRLGTSDPRWKWPQTIDVVGRLRPRYCVFENPPAILTAGKGEAFNGVVSRMAALGYDCRWDVIPAAAFGAGHWRERLCIVFADAQSIGKRIAPNEADTIAAGRDARDVASGESDFRSFSTDPHCPSGRSDAGILRAPQIEDGSEGPSRHTEHQHGGENRDAEKLPANTDCFNAHASGFCSGEISFEQASGIQQNFNGSLPSHTHNARLQGHSGNGAGDGGRSGSNGSTPAGGILPDLRNRVTGPDWWHEAVTGIPVLVPGLPGRLVEAASLCIGDSVVPQAWVPIAQAIAQALQTQRPDAAFLTSDVTKPSKP